VKVCDVAEVPPAGAVVECVVEGLSICLANIAGELSALDNWCPHRRGPLGQGWIEGKAVVCPWHSWAFDAKTGLAEYPEGERVAVFPVRLDGNEILIEID
jgi:nitrite reductase (NADH) small subunit